MSLSALKNSHLEQLNSDFFALLSTRLAILKIDHLIMRIGITGIKKPRKGLGYTQKNVIRKVA
ncbi:hypothetical protein CWC11_11520 [Pseudoalteromonas sp. S3178]|nr:hypothetical protein CWC11_11520 [Pseudoalteromonas sp. S3178]